MTFKVHTTDDGRITPMVKLPCSAITPKVGMALYMTGGQLALAGGSQLATHICMEEHDQAVAAGTLIHVITIQPDITFETQRLDADALVLGTAYDVAADAMSIDGTTTGANFVIDYIGGAAAGDTLRGRFVK